MARVNAYLADAVREAQPNISGITEAALTARGFAAIWSAVESPSSDMSPRTAL